MGKNRTRYALSVLLTVFFLFSAVGTASGFVDSDDLTVEAGGNVTVDYTVVANTGDEVVLDIKEYPEGWSVGSNRTDGSAWNPDKEKFVWLSAREGSQGSQALRPAVDISVPKNAVSGTHEFVAELTINGESEESETDSTEITVENGTVGTDELSGIAPTVTVGTGGTATVDYTLETEEGEQVVLSIEEYPEDWSVRPEDSDGGAWSSEDESFVWLESDGGIKTPSVEISVPEDGVLGSHEFVAELTVEGGAEDGSESGDGGEVTKHLTAVNVEEGMTGQGSNETDDEESDGEPEGNESDGDGNGESEGTQQEGLPGFGFGVAVCAVALLFGVRIRRLG